MRTLSTEDCVLYSYRLIVAASAEQHWAKRDPSMCGQARGIVHRIALQLLDAGAHPHDVRMLWQLGRKSV